MYITNTIENSKNSRKIPAFKNIATTATQALRYLNTSPAIGATVIDIGSMSAPRTIVDMSRGLDAGIETGIREGSGTVNHALIGTYGLFATFLLSQFFNRAYNVKSHKVFANFETIDAMGEVWQGVVNSNKNSSVNELRTKFLETVLTNLKGTTQLANGKLKRTAIDSTAVKSVVNELSDYISKNPTKYNIPSKLFNRAKSVLAYSTAAESNYVLRTGKKSLSTDLDTILKSTFSLGKLFSEPKALNEFKSGVDLASNKFIKSLKSTKLRSSLFGVAIGMAVGAMIQPLNVWLTKRRTGNDGFVGVEGEKKDNSSSFKTLKTASALGFLAFAYATIVDNVFKTPFKKQIGQFLNRLQFNGIIPSIPQFKAIYAFTIASRIMAARDKNELRESVTKDFLGFTNWLILGDFVQKIVATLMNKNLTNYDERVHGKGLLKKIFNTKVKTHDEISFEELKKLKLKPKDIRGIDGKMLSPRELINKFNDLLPNLKSRLRGKNIAQVSGYLYSALVLGILIPKINIALTNYLHNKNKESKPLNNETNKNIKTAS